MNEKIGIEYIEKKLRNHFGGSTLDVTYVMTHTKNQMTNKYRIVCEVGGLQDHEAILRPVSAEWIGDKETEGPEGTNDETLTDAAALELFEENM